MLGMVTPPGLEEYFGRWGEPLPGRTSTPSAADAPERMRTAVALESGYGIETVR